MPGGRAAALIMGLLALASLPIGGAFLAHPCPLALRATAKCFSVNGAREALTGGLPAPAKRTSGPATVCQFQLPKFNMPSFGRLGGQPQAAPPAEPQAPPPPPRVETLKKQLLAACDAAQKGVKGTGKMAREEFDALVDEIAGLSPTDGPAVSPLMGGSWELAWTTEKEVLFLIEKGLFWDQCTKVYQEIDLSAPSLSNNVEFENEGYLKVLSSFRPGEVGGDASRFDFKFNTLAVKWRQFELSLPPIGEGWSKQIYLDKTLRMQRDSRGDLAIYCKR